MANYTLRFFDKSENNQIETFATELSKIHIGINTDEIGNNINSGMIYLDVSTAIKFSKELRRQIAILKSGELNTLKDGQ